MHYIGYQTIEEWAKAIDRDYTAYAIVTAEIRQGSAGITDKKHVLTCAQPDEDAVHYCRVPLAMTQWSGDTCINSNQAEREEWVRNAWLQVSAWLTQNTPGWKVAAVAIPESMRSSLLEGSAEFLKRPGKDEKRSD